MSEPKQPKVKTIAISAESYMPEIEPGMALIYPIEDGKENPAKWFTYPSKKADRLYGDTKKYVIKKKNP